MMQTLQATIDENGRVSLSKPVRLPVRRRAIVTIPEEEPAEDADLAPAQTHAQMANSHRARSEQFAANELGCLSVELPVVDDGADW